VNLMSVIKSVGAGLLASTPLGAAALPVINAFLPADSKLTAQSTGADAQVAIDALPPAARESLLLAEINLEVEQERGRTARYQAMAAADGQQTRAKIVSRAMNTLTVLSVTFLLFVGWVYVTKGADAALNYELVALFFSVTGTYAYVIRAYFGDLRSETQSRHAAIDDKPQPAKGLAGLLTAMRS